MDFCTASIAVTIYRYIGLRLNCHYELIGPKEITVIISSHAMYARYNIIIYERLCL